MELINNINSTPNQKFTVTVAGNEYGFRIYFCDEFMAYDLSINGSAVITGMRMIYSQLMIPYKYQEVDGNFVMFTDGVDPVYTEFNVTQFLRYLSQSETDAWREMLKTGVYNE